jgi:TolB-like protein/Flp pilus assembly protein TadD
VLRLHFLGETRIERDGAVVELPPSRKTRALLAYLAITGRAHRRERICSLLWNRPDDPRGALRWSLSKLRQLVDEPGAARLLTRGETVSFAAGEAQIDVLNLRHRAARALETGAADELAALAREFGGEFLAGDELFDCHEFHAWCIAERAELQALNGRILRTLVDMSHCRPESALPHARALLQLEPHDESAWAGLIGLLSADGRRREARDHYELAQKVLKEAGVAPRGALPRIARDMMGASGSAGMASAAVLHRPSVHAVSDTAVMTLPASEAAKPTIVVVPFKSIGRDAEHEVLAEGVTEELTTMLSRVLGLFVIARDSAVRFKDRPSGASEAARELGVRYALHGSVRVSTDRIRVNAYLLDSDSGAEMWSERYDVAHRDVFAVQDEIAAHVVRALQVELLEGEQARAWHHSTISLEAWTWLTKGLAQYKRQTKQGVQKARLLFEKATIADPGYASAWAWLAYAHWHDARFLWAERPQEALVHAANVAERALALDAELPEVHGVLGLIRVLRGEFDAAIAAARRGVALQPNGAESMAILAFVLSWGGEAAEAARTAERAIGFCPLHSPWYLDTLGHARHLLRQFEPSVAIYRQAIAHLPDYVMPRIGLAACYAEMGRLQEAREQAREVLRIWPDFSIEKHTGMSRYRLAEHSERRLRALKAAGLP